MYADFINLKLSKLIILKINLRHASIRIINLINISILKVDCNSDNPIYKFNDESNQSNNTVNSESESNQAANRSLIKCTCIQEDQVKLESVNAFKIDFTLLSVQVRNIFLTLLIMGQLLNLFT